MQKLVTTGEWKTTTDIEVFTNHTGAKINYSSNRIANAFWICPFGLLHELGIREQKTDCFEYNNQKAFFKTEGDFSFDIFAAIFYLLSRYEEYLPHERDSYGRYDPKNALAFREGFLQTPLINYWLKDFRVALQSKFPQLVMADNQFTFLPTYDIDEAYSFKHKSLVRHLGAIVKSVAKGQSPQVADRVKVIQGRSADPFDSFAWMDDLHIKYKLAPAYFFLVPQKTGKYDRNILPSTTALQNLIRDISSKYKTGLHPSWQSGDDHSLLQQEKQWLEKITGHSIVASRQHFIRFTLPHTFRQLIETGMREDYSMGYGSINGFRASVSSPFYWYDLVKEESTNLLLYPFCFMEANSFFEQKHTPQQALEEMRHYYKQVKETNGTLITLWHNTFLGTADLFKGWREIYEQFISEVKA